MSESSESEVATALVLLAELYSICRYEVVATTCQTLLYGIYLCLFPIAIHVMVTNGLQSRARKWLLALTTFAFALSTVYWIFSVVLTFTLLDVWSSAVTVCFGSDDTVSCVISKILRLEFRMPAVPRSAMLANILFINFIIADGVTVWRTLVLCSDQSRIVLTIPVVMFVTNTVIYLTAVGVKAIMLIPETRLRPSYVLLARMLDGTVLTHLALSLLIIIYSTSIIAFKAWKYRKLLMESGIGIRTPRQAIRILAVLVESGMIYILIGVMILASAIFLHFEDGRIYSILIPVAQQFVGMYPIVEVLLVEKNRSPNSTISSFGTIIDAHGDRRPSQTAESLSFARGPVLASGGQIDISTTKPPITDIHVTSDHTLEPGGAGICPGDSRDSDSVEEHAIS